MIHWAWSYLTYERGARLITGGDDLPGWKTEHLQETSREPRCRVGRRPRVIGTVSVADIIKLS